MGHIPAPEEMLMLETMRRLAQMGHAIEDIQALVPTKPIRLLPAPDKEFKIGSPTGVCGWRLVRTDDKDETKDTKVKETPFPGEFTPLRI